MKRRDFITLLGGAAAAWPLAAEAQQGERVRRIGVLAGQNDDDPATRAGLAALREELAKLGWIEGRDLRIDLRFTGNDPDRLRAYAVELVSLAPEVIVTFGVATTRAAQEQTQTIPIVFMAGNDPVTNGLLQNTARPEGNTTGFPSTVDSLISKWLELLKEAAPHITRVALVFNPQTVNAPYFRPIEAAAPLLDVQALKTPYAIPWKWCARLMHSRPSRTVACSSCPSSPRTVTRCSFGSRHNTGCPAFTPIGATSPRAGSCATQRL
jgi:putative ABC transport system substrate-binding protein